MSKYIPGNQKHLSLEDRKYIERSLNSGTSFKDIHKQGTDSQTCHLRIYI